MDYANLAMRCAHRKSEPPPQTWAMPSCSCPARQRDRCPLGPLCAASPLFHAPQRATRVNRAQSYITPAAMHDGPQKPATRSTLIDFEIEPASRPRAGRAPDTAQRGRLGASLDADPFRAPCEPSSKRPPVPTNHPIKICGLGCNTMHRGAASEGAKPLHLVPYSTTWC
jgi:hypothetical protein